MVLAPDCEKVQIPRSRIKVSGRRYYSPNQGRFVGRDPIEETGGLNLYGFIANNPINLWDMLGMAFVNYDASIHSHLVDRQYEPGEMIWIDDDLLSTLPGPWSPDQPGDRNSGYNDGSFWGIEMPVAAVALPGVSAIKTHKITIRVGIDSSIISASAAIGAVKANAAKMQSMIDAIPALSHIQITVDNGIMYQGNAPENNSAYTVTPDGGNGQNAVLDMISAQRDLPGVVPILITNRDIVFFDSEDTAIHSSGITVNGGRGMRAANSGVLITGTRLLQEDMLIAHELGHVGGYSAPGLPPGPLSGHTTSPNNVMRQGGGGLKLGAAIVDANYIESIKRLSVIIPKG